MHGTWSLIGTQKAFAVHCHPSMGRNIRPYGVKDGPENRAMVAHIFPYCSSPHETHVVPYFGISPNLNLSMWNLPFWWGHLQQTQLSCGLSLQPNPASIGNSHIFPYFCSCLCSFDLVEGRTYRTPLNLIAQTMVSCQCSPKLIQWE